MFFSFIRFSWSDKEAHPNPETQLLGLASGGKVISNIVSGNFTKRWRGGWGGGGVCGKQTSRPMD